MGSVVTTKQWIFNGGWMGAVVRGPGWLLEYMCELYRSSTAWLGIGYLQRLPEQDPLHHTSTAVCTAVVKKYADG